MKKQKQVAPPQAPKKQPAPQEPVSKLGILYTIWEYEHNKSVDAINRFRDAIGPVGDLESGDARHNGSIAEAVEWHAYAAMEAEDFLRGEARWVGKQLAPMHAAPVDDLQVLAELQKGLEIQEERLRNDLLGNPLAGTSGGPGPWSARSTNELANVRFETTSNAKRRAYGMVCRMLAILSGE